MQKETVKASFARPKKPTSFLPRVIVLPKIDDKSDRDNEFEGGDPSNVLEMNNERDNSTPILNGKRSTKTVLQFIKQGPKTDKLAERTSDVLATHPNKPPIRFYRCFDKKKKVASFPNSTYNGIDDQRSLSQRRLSNPVFDKNTKPQVPLPQGTPLLQRKNSELSDVVDVDTFEDPRARILWHSNKDSALSRRESICSSCGGSYPYSNSFASTRRFSAVSIEVPNENLIKKSIINTHSALINEDMQAHAATTTSDDSPPQTLKQEEARKLILTKKRNKRVDKVDKGEYERIEKQRNLLYDLVTVIYKKNFVREEIRPYIRHALELCGSDLPKSK